MIKLVETEPTSPFDALWRQFPQLKNATCVGRMSWGDDQGNYGVVRTFRLIDGTYIRISSSKQEGTELIPIPGEELQIYKETWKQLGSRVLESQKYEPQPHGMTFASDMFFEITEELIFDLLEVDDEDEE